MNTFDAKEKAKWENLSRELNSMPGVIDGVRNSADNLQRLFLRDRAMIMEEGGTIIVFGALWDSNSNWLELGSVWVHPDHRGKGLSSIMFEKLIRLAKGGDIFLMTHNDRVVRLCNKYGFIEATRESWENHVPWRTSCGICDRWQTDDERRACPLKAIPTECRLFYMP